MQREMIQRLLGMLLMAFSSSMLPPIAVSFIYADGEAIHFILSLAITFGCGFGMWLPVRRQLVELRVRDGFIIVSDENGFA